MKKVFFFFWFKVLGWKVKGSAPDLKKYVIVIAPHTSNWDFFVGVAAKSIMQFKSDFLAKKSLFQNPLVGWFLRSIGGHPVDRSKKLNVVDQVVQLFQEKEEFIMTVTPEGTRSYNPKWKTGFYRIAHKAGVPIVMAGFDFSNKTVEMNEPFYPSGDLEVDINKMKAYFRTIKGRHPENGVK